MLSVSAENALNQDIIWLILAETRVNVNTKCIENNSITQ